jgi:protein SCO1/2
VALGVFVVTAVFALLHDADIDPRPRFSLINQDGVPADERLLLGGWNLVYFGFTNCPQVCPTQMAKVTSALCRIEQSDVEALIVPVFITVDPERDDPPAIKAYLTHFHRRFVGLTGDAGALRAAAGAFRAISGRVNGNKNDPDVPHSSAVYLVDPAGKIVTSFPYGATAPALIAGVRDYLP